ncbi:MAG: hypothetical protein B5M53_05735 [Candidatus Cloacimonas sp. 4484_209]|nr:MAG: hypothetical protein B5M53_05735 [Candidatus Cloacimonas sp. 4484_209]
MQEEKKSKTRTKRIAQTGIFTALAVVLGYLLVFIPNIELMSSVIFVSGWLFGPLVGITVGALSFAIFSLFNPLGASMPPLFFAQIIGGIIIGASGFLFKMVLTGLPVFLKVFIIGLGGGVVTFIFDILTNVGGFIAFTTKETFLAYLSTGIIFSILHIVSNMLIFTLIVLPAVNRIEHISKRKKGNIGEE